MANPVVLGNFNTILLRAKLVMTLSKPIADPFANAHSLDIFKNVVAKGRHLLPHRYQSRYVEVLAEAVQQTQASLLLLDPLDAKGREALFSRLALVFSVVAAPIVQLGSAKHQRELKAFLMEVSNIYRRFVNDAQLKKGAKFDILSPDLDPLAAFGHDENGPFTLPASDDLPVAIVSKPASQMHFLPLWAADGHEVGGHDIYGAVEGYEEDLKKALVANIRAAFRSGRVKTTTPTVEMPNSGLLGSLFGWLFGSTKEVSMEDFMVSLWSAWLSEASSDHAGLVNLGPMYLDSLMLLLSAVRPDSRISTNGIFDRKLFPANGGHEEHPIDLIRILLCLEAIKQLKFTNGEAYATALLNRLKNRFKGRLPRQVSWIDHNLKTVIEVDLADFQAVLPIVAETMLGARLPALANQSLGEILNWHNNDEDIVQLVARRLVVGDTQYNEEVEPRHIVAASMQALEIAATADMGISAFSKIARIIHDTGINMLSNMYDSQCLLCVEPDAISMTTNTTTVDWTRLVNHVRGRLHKLRVRAQHPVDRLKTFLRQRCWF